MTDLETMLGMLARAKIDFERRVIEDVVIPGAGQANAAIRSAGFTVLAVERGYHNFVSDIIFDTSGSLVSIEAYE